MIKIIAAIGDKNELGYMNDLPWDTITEDMAQFMHTTMDSTLIMGRLTWDSLDRNPLPGRTMVVVSRRKILMPKGHFWYKSPQEAFRKHRDSWLIGGASMYAYGMSFANEMLISHIDGEFTADRYFPKFNTEDWKEVESEQFDKFKQVRYVKRN